jgi:hypothetical protein
MFRILGVILYVLVAGQFFVSRTAEAESYSKLYARMLTYDDVRDVLRCPFCNYPVLDGSMYFVRTAEGLNVAFTDVSEAIDAVELLNVMFRAQSQCDKGEYEAAFENYATTMGLREKRLAQEPTNMDGAFGLLYPGRDLTSLVEYVVPPFHACVVRMAKARMGPGGAHRLTLRWSRR